jgi:hypothetical protein
MDIPIHPVLAKMSSENLANATAFCGYAGPSSMPGYIKLYPHLNDLSGSFEVATKDIIHFEKAPEAWLPFGGVAVWLREGAQVSSARLKEGNKVVEPAQTFDDVDSGRLRLRVRRETRGLVCTSQPFPPCGSHCSCQSHCCVLQPPK